jgi:hypothetical protein
VVCQQNPSALVDTRVIYCGDNFDSLRNLPQVCVELKYIDPNFNSTGVPLPRPDAAAEGSIR